MIITRGTTPTVSLTVTNFELKDTDIIHLYFSQKNKMKFKKVSPDVIVAGNIVSTELTQDDTFLLKKGEKCKIQFRVKSGETVRASGEIFAEVKDVDDDDEVI